MPNRTCRVCGAPTDGCVEEHPEQRKQSTCSLVCLRSHWRDTSRRNYNRRKQAAAIASPSECRWCLQVRPLVVVNRYCSRDCLGSARRHWDSHSPGHRDRCPLRILDCIQCGSAFVSRNTRLRCNDCITAKPSTVTDRRRRTSDRYKPQEAGGDGRAVQARGDLRARRLEVWNLWTPDRPRPPVPRPRLGLTRPRRPPGRRWPAQPSEQPGITPRMQLP